MTKASRLSAFAFLLLAFAAVLFLSAGLSDLELLPGRALPYEVPPTFSDGSPGPSSIGDLFFLILRGFLALLVVLFPVYILYSLFTAQGRRRLVADLGVLLLLVFLFSLLSGLPPQLALKEPTPAPQALPYPLLPAVPGTASSLETPETPTWLVILTSFTLALLVSGAGAGLLLLAGRFRRKAPASLERFASEAQAAMDSLQQGDRFQDVIVRCYLRMSQALEEGRGLQRGAAMTPREFERMLVESGLPGAPVSTLTRLFEAVRYGREQPDERMEQQAVASLQAIVASAGRQAGRERP